MVVLVLVEPLDELSDDPSCFSAPCDQIQSVLDRTIRKEEKCIPETDKYKQWDDGLRSLKQSRQTYHVQLCRRTSRSATSQPPVRTPKLFLLLLIGPSKPRQRIRHASRLIPERLHSRPKLQAE